MSSCNLVWWNWEY